MIRRLLLVAALVPLAVVLALDGRAAADADFDGGPDEYADRATPQEAPADTRPPAMSPTMSADGELTVFQAAAERVVIDDFRYDSLVLEGYARDVCSGGLLPGAGWAYSEIVNRFGGSPGTMYYCRERWDTASNPDCNGQLINPSRQPNFYSTCWSNHARGRAIDVMVGSSGGVYNQTRGINIVNWLLATDVSGNVNSNARRLGIQQILFSDRCWNSDGDRGISSWSAMRACGIGHFDHVHIDLTIDGANGSVSYWGATPRFAPRNDMQLFWEQSSNWREEVSWFNLVPTGEGRLVLDQRLDLVSVGDLDRNGTSDQTFYWDEETGDWAIHNWHRGDSYVVRRGRWGTNWDHFVVADLDGDGYSNDMWVWDRDAGTFMTVQWTSFTPRPMTMGYIHPNYDEIHPADLDGDGRVNDFLIYDRQSATWTAYSWSGWRATNRGSGRFPPGYDEVIVGDWSAGGDLDELILWDWLSGKWALYTWSAFRPTLARTGNFDPAVDIAVAGDYDTDGRLDDLFVYDIDTGSWTLFSFHRDVPTQRTRGVFGRGYDVISVGGFMY